MKKIIYVLATLLIISSCEKKEVKPTFKDSEQNILSDLGSTKPDTKRQAGVIVADGYVQFPNTDVYKSYIGRDNNQNQKALLARLNNDQSYISMEKYANTPAIRTNYIAKGQNSIKPESFYNLDFLRTILNPEGIVQIGSYIIIIDMEHEKVAIINEINKSLVSDVLNGAISVDTDLVKFFSTDFHLLDLLTSLERKNQGSNTGVGNPISNDGTDPSGVCHYPTNKGAFYTIYYTKNGEEYRAFTKLVYQRAAIYFSIQSEIVNQKKSTILGWVPHNASMSIYFCGNWVKKCDTNYNDSDCYSAKKYDYLQTQLSYRAYESIYRLSNFDVTSGFDVEGNSGLVLHIVG